MPLHTNRVEHEQYVLAGRARVVIGEETLEVKKDDVVFIPGGVPHSYEALGDRPFEFLCVVPNLPDETRILGGEAGGSTGAEPRESVQETPSPAQDTPQDLIVPEDELGC
jgi:uncharacterized RmlC-like cupin family protein